MRRVILIGIVLAGMVLPALATSPDKLWQQCIEGKKAWSVYVQKYAPDYSAYQAMVREIKENIDQQQYDLALEKIRHYENLFGDDPCYQDLKRILSDTTQHQTPTLLPGTINQNESEEYGGTLTPDERKLYFVVKGRRDNIGIEDIYLSRQDSSHSWTKAIPVRELCKVEGYRAPMAVHGRTMYLFDNGKILTSKLSNRGWGKPMPLPKHMMLSGWQGDVMITADGRTMFFVAVTRLDHQTYPCQNIYICHRKKNGQWPTPMPLGPEINQGNTRSPYMHPDGETFYFCSDAHSTIGGMDVFCCKKTGDDWNHWTSPTNLGTAVNSTGNECWYKISNNGRYALYAQKKDGQYDIYRQELPTDAQANATITIIGHLLNEEGQPVDATIYWQDLNSTDTIGEIEADPQDGSYAVVVPRGRNYGYWVSHPDYYPISETMEAVADENDVVEQDIALVSYQRLIEKEIPIRINNIFFAVGSAELQESSYPELQRLVGIVQQMGVGIEISGHTDNTGNDALNQELSQKRAEEVRRYLISHGCKEDQITAVGYGSSRPVADNESEEGRRENRRVEMRVTKPHPRPLS